jgi:hypothetical protein
MLNDNMAAGSPGRVNNNQDINIIEESSGLNTNRPLTTSELKIPSSTKKLSTAKKA